MTTQYKTNHQPGSARLGRFPRRLTALLIVTTAALALTGCANAPTGGPSGKSTTVPTIRIGTLQTDDILPLWAAVADGTAAAAGLNLDIQTFASAQE